MREIKSTGEGKLRGGRSVESSPPLNLGNQRLRGPPQYCDDQNEIIKLLVVLSVLDFEPTALSHSLFPATT